MEEFSILIMVVVINALIYTCGKFHRSTHTQRVHVKTGETRIGSIV